MNEELSSKQINRSSSVGLSPTIARFTPKQNQKLQCCHLISISLWEQISGEKLSQQNMTQLQELYLPQPAGAANVTTLTSTAMNYVRMAKDRQDCLLLQDLIAKGAPHEIDIIFNSLYPHMSELVADGAANFVIQKLCEKITPEQQNLLLRFFLDNMQRVIDQPNGCRVLQKFIETNENNKENIDKIFLKLQPKFVELCSSQNGNHIAQRFITYIPERVPMIIDTIKNHVVQLVVDNWGCRVIQTLFDKQEIEKLTPLVDEVLSCAADLATNQFGNYVVQNILASKKQGPINALINAFSGHFYEFSIHKFASNVIEKCIRQSNEEQRQRIFTEIVGKKDKYNYQRIYQMISDQFGNYVIQRIIEYGTEQQQCVIADVVHSNYSSLFRCNYAKHVISYLQNLGYRF